MAINAKKYKESVEKKVKTRDTVALYLDIDILERFKEACKPAKYGRILEKFMLEFIESVDSEEKIKKK